MTRSILISLLASFGILIAAGNSLADLVLADTTGTDNFVVEDFYGVEFLSGSRTIANVSWDLSNDTDAIFDFDGDGSFNNSVGPVFALLVGLDNTDVVFSWNANMLTATFPNANFNAGDSFRFAADTDFLGDTAETSGDVFGLLGVGFSVEFTDGTIVETQFQFDGQDNSSNALANTIPEPSVCMILFAAVPLALGRRRH